MIKKFAITVLAVVVLVATIAAYQDYRFHKIDFIIQDRQHNNVASLSKPDFIRSVQECGATVLDSGTTMQISYSGIFIRKSWTVDLKP
jgi:hypothetical protein